MSSLSKLDFAVNQSISIIVNSSETPFKRKQIEILLQKRFTNILINNYNRRYRYRYISLGIHI